MRRLAIALVPLFLFACDREPVAPDPGGPSFNASGEHRAIVVTEYGPSWLFDGAGNIVEVTCSRHHTVYTNNKADGVEFQSKCWAENPTGRAVTFTPDDNPYGPGLCAGWADPSGNFYLQCNWREVVAADGNINFRTWGTPIYP